MKTKYDFYQDPGHGWLKVTRKEIYKLGIENDISPFSYQRGDYVYLEEDGDLSKFLAKKISIGESVERRDHHSNKSSKIRSYEDYVPRL
jgi:hypothetical protein